MIALKEILKGVDTVSAKGDLDIAVKQIRFDSRDVTPGDLFVAVRGVATDGHAFIENAIKNGAVAVVFEENTGIDDNSVTSVQVKDAGSALGKMAANFFENPSKNLQLIGVTGTNGKTTTATLLWQLFSGLGFKSGLIGTVENRVGEVLMPSTHTTPDPVQLQALLANMVDSGCQYVFMEVSSHAIQQQRIAGALFAGGLFTNLTHDHLDYHKTFANYRDAKKIFFDQLPASAFALVNADDKNAGFMVQNTKALKKTFGLKSTADFKGKIIENSLSGLHLEIEGTEVFARMIGAFNASNLMGAYP